jgi:hypothetical protein
VRVYVVGAGVSKTVGYPLGAELLPEIDRFIRGSGRAYDRFDYIADWRDLNGWIEENSDPLIVETYKGGQLEYLLSILDLASLWREEQLSRSISSALAGRPRSAAGSDAVIEPYQRYRSMLLWALEAYLEYRHGLDVAASTGRDWDVLKEFARKLCPGDVVVTFNYDASLERVLLQQGRWSPRDGYGFDVVFADAGTNGRRLEFGRSRVTILHLHGAVGWYRRRLIRDDYELPAEGGAIPLEAGTPAPLDTQIALGPAFLADLGVPAVDAGLPSAPADEYQILLHPSFIKDYELAGVRGGNRALTKLWRAAADALRAAETVSVIGYSLPAPDSAALTLLLTTCEPEKVTIINRNPYANLRLRTLLSRSMGPPRQFEEWVRSIPDCPP